MVSELVLCVFGGGGAGGGSGLKCPVLLVGALRCL